MAVHACREGGAPVGIMDRPAYADPGSPVMVPGGLFGRVRLVWSCCATVLVERMSDPDSDTDPSTVTEAYTPDDLAPIPWGTPYSIPCIGSAWSLVLECGCLAGECSCAD